MKSLKKILFVMMPLFMLVSENAVAGGWHQKAHEIVLRLPECFQAFIYYLHFLFGWG